MLLIRTIKNLFLMIIYLMMMWVIIIIFLIKNYYFEKCNFKFIIILGHKRSLTSVLKVNYFIFNNFFFYIIKINYYKFFSVFLRKE